MYEAIDRVLWNATDEYKEFLDRMFEKAEEKIERLPESDHLSEISSSLSSSSR